MSHCRLMHHCFTGSDRTTEIGKMIDAYLTQKTDADDRVIHLLFAANRWERKCVKHTFSNSVVVLCYFLRVVQNPLTVVLCYLFLVIALCVFAYLFSHYFAYLSPSCLF